MALQFTIHLPQGRKVRFSDADFEEQKHPRAKSGPHGGEFVKKGSSGAGTGEKKGAAAGFLPASRAEKAFVAAGGKDLPPHIKKLRIPPAWTEVQYSSDPKSALLVVGRDAKGRPQRLYSEQHEKTRDANKFIRIKKLEAAFSKAVEKNNKLLKSKDPITRESATVLALIMTTGIRPGGERETFAERKAYGATTLLGSHVTTENGQTYLEFPGKSGKDLKIPVNDPEVAATVKKAAAKAGPNNQMFPLVSDRVLLAHTKSVAGAQFKTKDMRTLLSAKLAMAEISKHPVPKNQTQYKKQVRAVAQAVAEKLGNTATVALQSYIPPTVFAEWQAAIGGV